MSKKLTLERHHIRCAVGDGEGTSAMVVAACRVDEYRRGMGHVEEIFLGVATNDFRILHAEQRHVVGHYPTERLLPLHIRLVAEASRHEGEVHSESSRQVYVSFCIAVSQTLSQSLLVYGSRLRRTLFHG